MKAKELTDFLKKRYGERVRSHPVKNSDVFRILIKCILSQRTRDENTDKAAESLFSVAKTPERILKIPDNNMENLIKDAGFYRQKTKRIKEVCKILIEEYDGNVPRTREELLALPGVGYKTADIVLSYGYGVPTIAVDTHVNVISKRLGLVPENADVEEVRKGLEEQIPKDDRHIVNLGLVRFGQEICKTVKPKCELCPFTKSCRYQK